MRVPVCFLVELRPRLANGALNILNESFHDIKFGLGIFRKSLRRIPEARRELITDISRLLIVFHGKS